CAHEGAVIVLRADGILQSVAINDRAPERKWDLHRELGLTPSASTFVSLGFVASDKFAFVTEHEGALNLIEVELDGAGARATKLSRPTPSRTNPARGVSFARGTVFVGEGPPGRLDRVLAFDRDALDPRIIDPKGASLFAVTRDGDVVLGTNAE